MYSALKHQSLRQQLLGTVFNPPCCIGQRSNITRRDPLAEFNDCLNAVHPRVQLTREEEVNNSIAFLDVWVTRKDDGTIDTKVFRKPTSPILAKTPKRPFLPSKASSADVIVCVPHQSRQPMKSNLS